MLTLSQIAAKHGLTRARLESYVRRNKVRPAGSIKPPKRGRTNLYRESDFADYIKDARPECQAVHSLWCAVTADQKVRLNRMKDETGKSISTYCRQAIERELALGGW